MRYASPPFGHIYLVNDKLDVYTAEAFAEVEKVLGVIFPPLHKAFLQTIGKGVYCDHVRLHSPREILENHQKYYRNEGIEGVNGSIALTLEQMQTSIMVADSIDGDQIVFMPNELDKLYVLLRGYSYQKACVMPRGFLDLMLWIDLEGRIESASSFPYFTSWKDRKEHWFQATRKHIMLADITRHIEQRTSIHVKIQVSQRYEEGTSTTCFIPAIHGSVTFSENAIYGMQDIETLCSIEYDIEFESISKNIIASICDVGFQPVW